MNEIQYHIYSCMRCKACVFLDATEAENNPPMPESGACVECDAPYVYLGSTMLVQLPTDETPMIRSVPKTRRATVAGGPSSMG